MCLSAYLMLVLQAHGNKARRVERVLDVRQGQLCWVVGIAYVEMPLKPNVLDDISKEVSKYYQRRIEQFCSCKGSIG